VIIETFAVGPLACNCTILTDEKSGEAIVVDGGDGVEEVVRRLTARNLRATHLLHTHAHIDHIGNLAGLRERTGAKGLLHLVTQIQWADDALVHRLRHANEILEMRTLAILAGKIHA
jgi:glyoxylase-like metal-dependent hydrolase (beta-lactamase superfamily II)